MDSGARAQHEAHFNRLMPMPSIEQLRELLDVSFFASLMKEEGEQVSFTFGYIAQELGLESKWSIIRFPSPQPFAPETIRRLSPALVPDNVYCGVFPNSDGTLEVWGLIYLPRSIGSLTGIMISSYQPGAILVRRSRQDIMIYSRGEVTLLDEKESLGQTGLRTLLANLVGDDPFPQRFRIAAQLLSLASVALQGGRGATFLVIPRDTEPKGLSQPRIRPDDQSRSLISAALQNPAFESLPDLLARLSFMDGAMVLDDALNLFGAGAMIESPSELAEKDIHVVLVDPSKTTDLSKTISINDFSGGARHRSAIQFCYSNPGCVALVVSHDGVMSLMGRGTKEDFVLVLRPFYPGVAGL